MVDARMRRRRRGFLLRFLLQRAPLPTEWPRIATRANPSNQNAEIDFGAVSGIFPPFAGLYSEDL